jgi:hypothetical protein
MMRARSRTPLPLDDAPEAMRRHATAISRACIALVLVALAEQVWEIASAFRDGAIEGDDVNPWIGIALGFLSSAALGIDAVVMGVRRQRGFGPSIRNLAPGGWATFGAMMWVLAVPAYFLGARRRAVRGDDDGEREPLTLGSWIAIAVPLAIGLFAAFAALIT